MPVFLYFNLGEEVIIMFSECSFKNATVPELISAVKQLIGQYQAVHAPDLLEEIHGCIEEARQILNRSLVKTGANDQKRLSVIERKRQEIVELEQQIRNLEKRR